MNDVKCSMSCLHSFLWGRKMKTSCWENWGRVFVFQFQKSTVTCRRALVCVFIIPWVQTGYCLEVLTAQWFAGRLRSAGGCEHPVSAAPSPLPASGLRWGLCQELCWPGARAEQKGRQLASAFRVTRDVLFCVYALPCYLPAGGTKWIAL